MLESLIIIAFYIGAFSLPFFVAIGIYYLVILLVYWKYKRNGGIYSFRKFIARRGLEL